MLFSELMGQFLSLELTAPGWAWGQCASSCPSLPVGQIQPWHNKLGRICSARKEVLVRFVMLLTVHLSWLAIYLERFLSWLSPFYSKKTHLWTLVFICLGKIEWSGLFPFCSFFKKKYACFRERNNSKTLGEGGWTGKVKLAWCSSV